MYYLSFPFETPTYYAPKADFFWLLEEVQLGILNQYIQYFVMQEEYPYTPAFGDGYEPLTSIEDLSTWTMLIKMNLLDTLSPNSIVAIGLQEQGTEMGLMGVKTGQSGDFYSISFNANDIVKTGVLADGPPLWFDRNMALPDEKSFEAKERAKNYEFRFWKDNTGAEDDWDEIGYDLVYIEYNENSDQWAAFKSTVFPSAYDMWEGAFGLAMTTTAALATLLTLF